MTFMRVKDGKLDPTDSYQSEWIGTAGDRITVLEASGTPLAGIVGRYNAFECRGMGLILK